jgi:AcrR family transcriptional regulator
MAIGSVANRGGSALRDRIVEAASKVFVEEGYENLSMRRVALEAGCSQMAMYRHFANKEALIQHLCAQLYSRFVVKMNHEIESVDDPWEKLNRFIVAIIGFATSYPDHYSLIFLVRYSDPEVIADRERLGQEFIARIREIMQAALPSRTSSTMVDMRVRQMLTSLHGTAALLIAHPRAYGLTKQKAINDAKATFYSLLGRGD